MTIPLRFDLESGKSSRQGPPRLEYGELTCSSTSRGLLLTINDFGGLSELWMIPSSELQPWRDRAFSAKYNLPRSQPGWLRRFDLNHDGYLDSDESKAMFADTNSRE